MSTYLTLADLDPAGKRVLLRSDLNVPLDEGEAAGGERAGGALGAQDQRPAKIAQRSSHPPGLSRKSPTASRSDTARCISSCDSRSSPAAP